MFGNEQRSLFITVYALDYLDIATRLLNLVAAGRLMPEHSGTAHFTVLLLDPEKEEAVRRWAASAEACFLIDGCHIQRSYINLDIPVTPAEVEPVVIDEIKI